SSGGPRTAAPTSRPFFSELPGLSKIPVLSGLSRLSRLSRLYYHFHATPGLDQFCGRLFRYGDFEEAGAAEISKQLVLARFSKVSQQTRGLMLTDPNLHRRGCHLPGQLGPGDIGYDIAEPVHVNDRAPDLSRRQGCRPGYVELDRIIDFIAEHSTFDAL